MSKFRHFKYNIFQGFLLQITISSESIKKEYFSGNLLSLIKNERNFELFDSVSL